MLWAVVFLIAISVSLLVVGIANLSPVRGRVVKTRLEQIQTGGPTRELRDRRRRQRRREQLQTLLEALGERITGERTREMKKTEELLVHAGFRHPNAMPIFFAIRLLLAAGLGAATLLLATTRGLQTTQIALFTAVGGLSGWLLPIFFMRVRRDRRQKELQRGLPDALDLLVVCVEAGLGLNQALVRVSEEVDRISKDLSEELMIVTLQIRAGTPRPDALRNLAERTGLEDVRSLVGMLIQTDRFGTSVGKSLRIHAETLRDKRRQRAEEAAAKLSIKMLFPLVFLIFPAIFVVLLGPAVFQLMEVFGGL